MGKRNKQRHLTQGRTTSAAALQPALGLQKKVMISSAQPSSWKEKLLLLLFWSYVLIPLAWGVTATVRKAMMLFK